MSIGCGHSYVTVTTTELGRALDVSQQAASIQLTELERDGMINRLAGGRSNRICVTDRGRSEVVRISLLLKTAIKENIRVLDGMVVSGVGEGAYYMSLPGYVKQFQALLGMVPYPGTLNIRLDAESVGVVMALGNSEGTLIRGFDDGKRTYGWVRCYGALLQAISDGQPDGRQIPVYLIRLERTHHETSVAEIISPENLRESVTIHDGSHVRITLE